MTIYLLNDLSIPPIPLSLSLKLPKKTKFGINYSELSQNSKNDKKENNDSALKRI